MKTTDSNFVKIGYTKYRDQMRIDQINSSSPLPCELALFIEGDLYDEKSLHKLFENDRVDGKNEWFKYSHQISKYISDNKGISEIPIKRLEGVRKGNKTSPFGCRFDIEKLDFIQKRERLESYQKVVDFLLNKYWWEHKLPHVTAKEVPPMELNASFQDLTKPTNEIKPFEQPKSNYEIKTPPKPESVPLGSFDGLKAKILETKQVKELEAVMKEIKTALMPLRFKQQLEAIAKEHSKEFFTD